MMLALAGVLFGAPSAQAIDPAKVFLSGELEIAGSPLLAVGERVGHPASQEQMDYAVFIHELLAYVTKEVISDSKDEYRYSSSIPSRLSPEMPDSPSKFGGHCLAVLASIGSGLPAIPLFWQDSPSLASYVARAGTTALAVRQVWSAFRNDIEDSRSGFSLDPKVSPNKIGIGLTFRW